MLDRLGNKAGKKGYRITMVDLVCPQCRQQRRYEERSIDTSSKITCSACGFSELPTGFELALRQEKKRWQITKIAIIILVGVLFVTVGLFVIALAAFYLPLIIAAVILVMIYQRWRERNVNN